MKGLIARLRERPKLRLGNEHRQAVIMAAVRTDKNKINCLHSSIINISPWECESYIIKWDTNMRKQDSEKKGLISVGMNKSEHLNKQSTFRKSYIQ